ncbi:MAG: hypothetical protein GF329_15565 [Candidatus Lokiarchaeota archaeon]|nr:hypothetical protein [Candidatus Lokiarchaeota archaeon]
MPCPRCGKDTPGDSFCSIKCMKLYKGKKINEAEEFKKRYEMLDELTNDFTECPFCRQIRLVTSKPKPPKNDTELLEKNLYCPRCYRVFGHLLGKEEDEEEDWEFKKIPFEEAKEILRDLQEIIKEVEDEE